MSTNIFPNQDGGAKVLHLTTARRGELLTADYTSEAGVQATIAADIRGNEIIANRRRELIAGIEPLLRPHFGSELFDLDEELRKLPVAMLSAIADALADKPPF